MFDVRDGFGETLIAKEPSIRQDVQRCLRKPILALSNDANQALLKECRLPSRDAEFSRLRVDEPNEPQMPVNDSSFVDISGRLGTHHAEAVAVIRGKYRIVLRVSPIKRADITPAVNGDHIPSRSSRRA
jgi:hypothetical protein